VNAHAPTRRARIFAALRIMPDLDADHPPARGSSIAAE